jgi:hypothetical protein
MNIGHRKFKPYFNPGLGEWVQSPSHYKQLLKKHDCVEVGTEDIRSDRHKGMSAEDVKYMHHPELMKKLNRKKYFNGVGNGII